MKTEESHLATHAQEDELAAEEASAVTVQKFAGDSLGIQATPGEEGVMDAEMDGSSHAKAKDQKLTLGEDETHDAGMPESSRVAAGDQQSFLDERGVVDVCKSARVLLRAILKLSTASRADVARIASEATQTEDQRPLRNLRCLYDEFLPALSAIRNSAVDRMVLSRPEERAVLEAAAAVTKGWYTTRTLRSVRAPANRQGADCTPRGAISREG